MTTTSPIPSFLLKRGIGDEYLGKRYLENEEVALLSVLDEEGQISSSQTLLHLMCLLNKVIKMDHRILGLEILHHHMVEGLHLDFVEFGGYRLLKRWLQSAERDNRSAELRAIVSFCRTLPFDSGIIKRTEIGKAIKKLQKYQTNSSEGPNLQKEVQLLMEDWKEKAMVEKRAQQRPTTKTMPMNQEDSSKELTTRKEDSPNEAVAMDVEEEDQPKSMQSPLPSPARATTERVSIITPTIPPEPVLKPKDEPSSFLPVKPAPLLPFLTNSNMPAAAAALLATPAKSAPARERKSLDMVEGARRLLAQRKVSQETPVPTVEEEISVKNEVVLDLKPLAKGGLKRNRDGAKRDKRTVQWADESGGLLREVHQIEVDRIKSTVASYKSHKDLVRKERQLEKETYLSKAEEAMRPAIPFTMPNAWQLPIGILDNIGVANSVDKQKQTRRIAHVLEIRYLDDSLIPDDPDVDQNSILALKGGNMDDSSSSTATPWLLPDEEEILSARPYQLNSLPSSSSTLGPMGGGSMTAHFPDSQTGLSSSSGLPRDDEYALLASLPIGIQMLDPLTLQVVLQDPQLLQSLLRSDGSVDETHLSLLQTCTSVEEYRANLMASVAMPSYGINNYSNVMPSYGSHGMNGMGTGNDVPMFDNMQMPANNNNLHQAWDRYGMSSNESSNWNNLNMNMGMNMNIPMNMSVPAVTTITTASSAGVSGGSKRFPTTKQSTPCRFFNTPRGCANGDKCPFGHFVDSNAVSAAAQSGPTRAAGMNRPGARRR
eukprot:gene1828-1998_t